LAKNIFWLFPETKSALKARIFQDAEDIQKNYDDGTGTCTTTGVPKYFQQWAKCMPAQGEYLEVDPAQKAVIIIQLCL
jgi:hypothetical protein